MRRSMLATVAAVSLFGGAANAEIFVADTVRYEVMNQAQFVAPGSRLQWDFAFDRGDVAEVSVQLAPTSVSGIGAFICPQAEYIKYVNGQTPQFCGGVQRGERNLTFSYNAPYSGAYVLFIDNTHSVFSQKAATVSLIATQRTTEEFRSTMTETMRSVMFALHETFIFDDFNINISPCGQENAFSDGANGDVTFCSELLFRLANNENVGALMGILFHEFGHTLLNLWGEPNWRNEQVVDEFATVFLLQSGGRELLEQFVSFFAGHDPIAEAMVMQYANSPHPLSVQRMRNISDIIDHPEDYVRRWTKTFYRHAKTERLQAEIDAPDQFANPMLARSILREREIASAN